MKKVVTYKSGEFIDFKGNYRKYIMAAVSEEIPTVAVMTNDDLTDFYNDDFDEDEDGVLVGASAFSTKRLSLGLAVVNYKKKKEIINGKEVEVTTNELDDFNEAIGKEIAKGKAEKRPVGQIFATKDGFINSEVVEAFLKQESAFFEKCPGTMIAGYDEAAKKWAEQHDKN